MQDMLSTEFSVQIAYGWGFAADPIYIYDWDWANYLEIMKEVDIDMTISRYIGEVALVATLTTPDGTEYNYSVALTTSASESDPMYFFLLSEQAYLEIMSIE